MFTATPTATHGIVIHLIVKSLVLLKHTRRRAGRFLFFKDENLGEVVEPQENLVTTLHRVARKIGKACRNLSSRPR
jgi:hypothetical protein